MLFHQSMLRSVRRGQNFTVIRSPRSAGAGFHHDAFTTGRRWQNFTVMRSPRVDGGRISQRCVLRVSTVAKYSPNAFPGTHPWQDFRLMYAKRSLGRKNTPSVATYRRYVSKMSWSWQDLRAAHPKSPANRCLGIHIVKNLPGRAPFSPEAPKSYIACISCHPISLNRAKSPAPDRLHLQSFEQSALPPASYLHKHKKGDPVGSPFNSGTDQKNQLKVIVDDPYLYRSSFSFAAS